MADVTRNRKNGNLCTTSNGNVIIYRGHLCEGTNLVGGSNVEFCLWFRCGQRDVPANQAHEGDIREVDCPSCLAIWNEENGQFGVGA